MEIYAVYVFFIIVFAAWYGYSLSQWKKQRAYLLNLAAENAMTANHWRGQFTDVVEGENSAWARRMLLENEALSKGLDEAVDDHMQEQASWNDSRTQYLATIEDLEDQVHAYREVAVQKDMELRDVQQTALEMQIDLTAPEAKTPAQVYRETQEARRTSGLLPRVVDHDSDEVIGQVTEVRTTENGVEIDFTPNEKFPKELLPE